MSQNKNNSDDNVIYRDSTQPVEVRVADLLSRMTLAEKLAQLGSAWVFELLTDMTFDLSKAQQLMAHGLGHITRMAGASSLSRLMGRHWLTLFNVI